jgi:imidazole glycerol phosphate synthase subunit HisF
MTLRIIPRLDIKGPNLVKGIRFEGLRRVKYSQDLK